MIINILQYHYGVVFWYTYKYIIVMVKYSITKILILTMDRNEIIDLK